MPWTDCSAKCGVGTRTRSRAVTTEPAHGGKACPALTESKPCEGPPCPVDCDVSDWMPWTDCSAKCGVGTRTRSRAVTTEPAHGGKACPALTESTPCEGPPCSVGETTQT